MSPHKSPRTIRQMASKQTIRDAMRETRRRRLVEAVDSSHLRKNRIAEKMGIDATALSHILAGRRNITEELALRASEVLGISMEDLGYVDANRAPIEPYEVEARTPDPTGAGQVWRDFARQHSQFANAATLAKDSESVEVTDAMLDVAARNLGERASGTYTAEEIEQAILDAVQQKSRIDALLKSAVVMTHEDLSSKPRTR